LPEPTDARLLREHPDGSATSTALRADVTVVGRDEQADVCIDEPLVSRVHARVERRGDGFWVIDLGSTNQTRVNGEIVRERRLRDGDELRFARAVFRFRVGPPEPPPADAGA